MTVLFTPFIDWNLKEMALTFPPPPRIDVFKKKKKMVLTFGAWHVDYRSTMIGAETIQSLTPPPWWTPSPRFWGNSRLQWWALLFNTVGLLLPQVRSSPGYLNKLQLGGARVFHQCLSPCRCKCIIILTCHLGQCHLKLPQEWCSLLCRVACLNHQCCPVMDLGRCNSYRWRRQVGVKELPWLFHLLAFGLLLLSPFLWL